MGKHPDPTPAGYAPRRYPTGAKPAPRQTLLGATPFVPTPLLAAAPTEFALVPRTLSMWGNDQHGCCVTSEEAFAKACHAPEVFISDYDVIAWARRHGVLEGAYLLPVIQSMQTDGFVQGATTYEDGQPLGVDFSNEAVLQAAIAESGPVKIGIDHSALPPAAGNQQGWHAVGGSPGRFGNLDHCVSLSGYGPAAWLYQQLGLSLPPDLPPGLPGYLLFTWSTLGFVDHAWIMSTTGEAWVRNPTTIIRGSTPTPTPTPAPAFRLTFAVRVPAGGTVRINAFRARNAIEAGTYDVVPVNRPSVPLGE